jgi:signal transduction histidine kinase
MFVAGERLEFQQQDYPGAIAIFRKLSQSRDIAVRVGALLRVGRNLRKAGRIEEALETYAELAKAGSTPVAGQPAELLARQVRCSLLEEGKRLSDLEREVGSLSRDLRQGRWRLTRSTYRYYSEEVQRWLDPKSAEGADIKAGDQQALALAAAVESLWEEWQRICRGESETTGRRSRWVYDQSILLLWRSTPERLVALVAGAHHFESQRLPRSQVLMQKLGVEVALTDSEGHFALGRFPGAGVQQALRTAADTRLPWTLHVTSADPPAETTALAGRRRLLMAGLAMMALLLLTVSYFSVRAFAREMAVARLQSDFVAAVSHEFRTPLTSMRQLTEMLARGRVPSEERRQQYYEVLAHETGRLHRLVEGLLNFGRMEASALEYRFEPIDAAALVRSVAQEFQEQTRGRGYCIELNAAQEGPLIRADKESIERALWNLLDNAVKYSPTCQTVWLELLRKEQHLLIRVRDHGLGIPPGELKEIFKKFVRGDAARSTNVKGTGIGLTMVHHIVEAHGGEIRVESMPNQGSTFTIVLPVEE